MFVTYNPDAISPAPVSQMGSGSSPNPTAVHVLTSSEQSLVIANDPLSIQVDLSTSPPSITSNPNFWVTRGWYYKGSQLSQVNAGFLSAITAPFSFMNAAGVTTSYAISTTFQKEELSNSYVMYVLGGEPLPSGFTIVDANNIPQTFTVGDIKGLYTGIISFMQKCKVQLNTLGGEIEVSVSFAQCISYMWSTP